MKENKQKIKLALGIIAGTEAGYYNYWKDFFDIEPPNLYKTQPFSEGNDDETSYEYELRIEKLIKEKAVEYLGELLSK